MLSWPCSSLPVMPSVDIELYILKLHLTQYLLSTGGEIEFLKGI